MNISEVVKKTGIPASTIRYYEEIGLIKSQGRHGLQRVFSGHIIDQLSLISLAKCADFSLPEIKQMLGSGSEYQVDRTLLLKKADEIEETINRLTLMSKYLKHAATCRAPSHLECPTFRTLMKAALKGKLD